jgi:hypothetical protein
MRYLTLAGARATRQITFVDAPGSQSPSDQLPVDLLYSPGVREAVSELDLRGSQHDTLCAHLR